MSGFWIYQDSDYVRVTQGSKYATVRLNMSEKYMNMSEYVWIYDNRQGPEYVSYNT